MTILSQPSNNSKPDMEEESYDYIIVGAGIEGSATALELARRKKRTLLLEQFELGKSDGSSQGKSRIIRHSYKEDYFTSMTFEAYEEWFKIEKETGNNIYSKTGLLTVDKPLSEHLNDVCNALIKFNHPFEYLDSGTLHNRFPLLNLPECAAVYEADGGVLKADIALKSIQDLYVKAGGKAKGNSKVISIEPTPDKITIKTDVNDVYVANSIIICAGPWAPDLLESIGLDLPLDVVEIGVTYWKERHEGAYSSDKFPCIIDSTSGFYSLPSLEYPGHVKVMLNMGYQPSTENRIEKLSKYVRHFFPELDSTAPSREEKCYYTNTPDEAFVLDRHPNYKNIIIGAGFSGTGFKLAPVVGKILANFADGTNQDYDLQPFRINRFK
uniref:FAD dependent oxidoreductase domain-containing protein n=1 Tax=Strigamia maritima TaxID=126957 RepID=T1JLS5_STRMM